MTIKEALAKLPGGKVLIPKYEFKKGRAKGLELSVSIEQKDLIQCKDCIYFEYDSYSSIDGIPLIMAHEICNRWGEGCKTNENGWCFLAEPKENITQKAEEGKE